SATDPLVRRASRHHRIDYRRAALSHLSARAVQRGLAAGTGGLQRWRRYRQPGYRAQPEAGPADRLLEPAAAQGNPRLRAQAAGPVAIDTGTRDLRNQPQPDRQRALLRSRGA